MAVLDRFHCSKFISTCIHNPARHTFHVQGYNPDSQVNWSSGIVLLHGLLVILCANWWLFPLAPPLETPGHTYVQGEGLGICCRGVVKWTQLQLSLREWGNYVSSAIKATVPTVINSKSCPILGSVDSMYMAIESGVFNILPVCVIDWTRPKHSQYITWEGAVKDGTWGLATVLVFFWVHVRANFSLYLG